MKSTWVLMRWAAMFVVCVVLLTTCAYGPNRLRVVIAKEAILAPMVGHVVYVGVFDLQAPVGSDVVGRGYDTLTTTEQSKMISVMAVPSDTGRDPWEGVAGTTYGLKVWVDLNDNYPTATKPPESDPESGIDYVTSPAQLAFVATPDFLGTEVTIDQLVRAP